MPHLSASVRTRTLRRLTLLVVAALALTSVGLRAQLPAPATAASQFDITGFLQSATLDGVGAGALQGGHLVVNGHTVVVPSNTIVILPANALTWAELFTTAPAPYTGTQTGLALNDNPAPLTTYQVHVVGNKVAGEYRAGLVNIAQDALNTGAGYINFIDYTTGEIFVGGTTADRTTGARIAINDPIGRYGRVVSPDPRFTVDFENPTIRSVTGYPMCIPRAAGDPLCPQSNRKLDPAAPAGFAGVFTMNAPAVAPAPPLTSLDPMIEAPFEIGDYVTFAGTLVHDGATPTAGPLPCPLTPATCTYVSAHTITNNIAIYTSPGSDPAYIAIDVALLGTGGVTAAGLTEAAVRTRFEGFATDVTRVVHLYGIDVSSPSGATSDRDWGKAGMDNGIVALGGAVAGRWRFRPPCTATVVGINTKGCVPPAAGVFLPATRELRAVVETTTGTPAVRIVTANGLTSGQYHAPIGEYIFPEQIPGAPVPPANFETIPFLASGGYTSSGGFVPNTNLNGPFVANPGTVATGALNPWVADASPLPPPPLPPSVAVNCPTSITSGSTVNCTSTSSAVPPAAIATWLWSATKGTFGSPTTANTTYVAPVVTAAETQTISLTVTDTNGLSSTNSVTVTITPQVLPIASITPAGPVTVVTGTPVSLTGNCADQNVPALACTTFTWTQLNAGAPGVPTIAPNPSSGQTLSFTPTLALGQPAATMQLSLVATNSAGVASAPVNINVTVTPIADTVTVTGVVYRVGKQRLDVTATSSVVSPNVVLTLQPYLTVNGTILDPGATGIMLNTGGGAYTLTLVGVPEPAAGTLLTVTSNLGGSGSSPVTRLR
jgi:hypothetical protein